MLVYRTISLLNTKFHAGVDTLDDSKRIQTLEIGFYTEKKYCILCQIDTDPYPIFGQHPMVGHFEFLARFLSNYYKISV